MTLQEMFDRVDALKARVRDEDLSKPVALDVASAEDYYRNKMGSDDPVVLTSLRLESCEDTVNLCVNWE